MSSTIRHARSDMARILKRIPSLHWQDDYCRSLTSSPASVLLCG